jgi:capsular polysaccharide export protein
MRSSLNRTREAVGGPKRWIADEFPSLRPHARKLTPVFAHDSVLLQTPPFRRLRQPIAVRLSGLTEVASAPWPESPLCGGHRLDERDRLDRLAARLQQARVGGAFWAPPIPSHSSARCVLRPRSLQEAKAWLADRLAERSAQDLLVLLPDARWARACQLALTTLGVGVVLGETDPWSALDQADEVAGHEQDHLVMLAALAGRRVRLLDSATRATHPDAVREPVYRALVGEVEYRDPFDGLPISCEDAIDVLADWRRHLERTRGIAVCCGVSWWKRRALSQLLDPLGESNIRGRATATAVCRDRRRHGAVTVWASREPSDLQSQADRAGVAVWRVEDGFLRSVGLGSDLRPPCSIVLDRRGAHYQPQPISDLQQILEETVFSPDLLGRADQLIRTLLVQGATKYATGRTQVADLPSGRRIVLAIGQVEDDISVRLAGCGQATDLAFLARIRALEPDSFIVFKPHPDVVAGHRRGALDDHKVRDLADAIVSNTNPEGLLRRVDAVHTLSSLTGFEALLRGREVVVHGQPFYAGWGLTRDLTPLARRRRLSLRELVAGALLLYPLYRDPISGLPCAPEVLLRRLTAASEPSLLSRAWRLQGSVLGRRRQALQLRAAS